ncbi:MAG TPA: XdhC family protein [Trebonia sp.]|jgi:xanthine dehydrogenase accessory factor|nr:XdhC family protein [Trebonia sp.]
MDDSVGPDDLAGLAGRPPVTPGLEILWQASELSRHGEPFALATVVWRQGPSSGKQGSRAIVTADGQLRGWIGGACAEPTVVREARQSIIDGQARLLLLGPADKFGGAVQDGMTIVSISCQSEGALEVYIEPVLPAPHLVIVGDSPMVTVLGQLATSLGWAVDRVPGGQFTAGFAGEQVSSRSMVVVATQGHGDEDMIARAAASRPAYLGLVGSRKRGLAVLGYLADRGLAQDDLDRVRVPAGLDLGRTTHEEMAVAILAELVQLRAAGDLDAGPVPAARRGEPAPVFQPPAFRLPVPAGRLLPVVPAAEVTDPVCGMTVTADAAHYPLEHDGTTDYFCCAGCRQSFETERVS